MINEYYAKKYCKDDISKIENYELALNDKTQTWDLHHRRETIFSRKDLIEIGEYYNRPAIELIFLTPKEHNCLHKNGKHHSKETRKKMSKTRKGKKFNEEHKRKMSKAHKGIALSEEHKRKISESKTGKKREPFSEETKLKISQAIKLYWARKKVAK